MESNARSILCAPPEYLKHLPQQAITPRPPAVGSETCAFPALASGTSIDGGGSAFGISTNARQLRLSRRETRNRADNMRAKRKEVGGSFTSGTGDGQRVRRRRSGASSCGIGGGDDGGDNSTLAGGCLTEEGFRGGGQGHEVGTRERGDPDDATCSWSTWHPTGIPSWDILVGGVATSGSTACFKSVVFPSSFVHVAAPD